MYNKPIANFIIPNFANSSIPSDTVPPEVSTNIELTIKLVEVPTKVNVPPKIAA